MTVETNCENQQEKNDEKRNGRFRRFLAQVRFSFNAKQK